MPGFQARAQSERPILFGTTPVFLDDQILFLNKWQHYLEVRLNRPVVFVQRETYTEITDLVIKGKLDFAWICGYPYTRFKPYMKLVAVPIFQGKPLYRAYVIVPQTDAVTHSLMDLKDKIYAFSDPLSNSGWLVAQAEIKRNGYVPANFFRKSFFTLAHRKVVEAVAIKLAQGGSVDGYVWETLNVTHPDLTARTRIVEKSAEYGFPPIVAYKNVDPSEYSAVQEILIGMKEDPAGRALLKQLNLDGFEQGNDHIFDDIKRNMQFVGVD
ncbi:PhnD/SsuA/transferrin family substrate-binding protein [Sulfuriferula sp. AH1]|uniref:substrate-binding domain-containing protein n=1 Tax=Sulfuriferula sp. AH1 TaxID=1985873 RepID=UPI001CB948DA|nr:PhnD/SsuA/transferrin family substrate-binding protein [Sulfuriferula sp. AH1]